MKTEPNQRTRANGHHLSFSAQPRIVIRPPPGWPWLTAERSVKAIVPALLLLVSLVGCAGRSPDEQMYLDSIAEARTPRERRLAEHEYRLHKEGRDHRNPSSVVVLRDGVDEFEAVVLSRLYVQQEFGFCTYVGLPERHGDHWLVAVEVGRDSRPVPPVVVRAADGRIECEGHRTVVDIPTFLRAFDESPNQSVETTRGTEP